VFGFPENIGRTPALRYALDQARAEYVAVLDADDIAHPERFAKQVRFLDQHAEAVLVGSWAHLIDAQGAVFDSWEPPAAATELLECFAWVNPIINSSVLYRRAEALAAGGYPSDLHYGQDLALIMNLTTEGQLAIIPEHLCQLRVVGGRMSNAGLFRLAVNEEKLRLLRAAATQLPLRTGTLRRNRRAIAFAEMRYGIALVRAMSISRGAKLILRGLRRDPSALWRNSIVRRRLGYGEFGNRFLSL
jgi:glycosyltransferase involved in cell wall biosynthesis